MQKDLELQSYYEQYTIAQNEVSRLMEDNESVKLEKAQLAKSKAQAEFAKVFPFSFPFPFFWGVSD